MDPREESEDGKVTFPMRPGKKRLLVRQGSAKAPAPAGGPGAGTGAGRRTRRVRVSKSISSDEVVYEPTPAAAAAEGGLESPEIVYKSPYGPLSQGKAVVAAPVRPRRDEGNGVVPYSILGRVEDYLRLSGEAAERRECAGSRASSRSSRRSSTAALDEMRRSRSSMVFEANDLPSTCQEQPSAEAASRGLEGQTDAPGSGEYLERVREAAREEIARRAEAAKTRELAERNDRLNGMLQYERLMYDRHERALKLYEHWQDEWARYKNSMCELSGRKVDQLVMSRSDEFRERVEEYKFIDAATPHYQKHGSEYWMMSLRGMGTRYVAVGNIFSGLFCPVRETSGIGIETIRVPRSHGNNARNGLATENNEPAKASWRHSRSLAHRKKQLEKALALVRPHKLSHADADALIVTGEPLLEWAFVSVEKAALEELVKNKAQQGADDALAANREAAAKVAAQALETTAAQRRPTDGPRLAVEIGQGEGQCGLAGNAVANFFTSTGETATSSVTVRNVGTTAIYFEWLRDMSEEPASRKVFNTDEQRFFCSHQNGVVLPGASCCITFAFCSSTPGSFGETWRIETQPKLLSVDGDDAVQLRGLANAPDESRMARLALELELEAKEQERETAWQAFLESLNVPLPPKPVPTEAQLRERFELANRALGLYFEKSAQPELEALAQRVFDFLHSHDLVRAPEERAASVRADVERWLEHPSLVLLRAEIFKIKAGKPLRPASRAPTVISEPEAYFLDGLDHARLEIDAPEIEVTLRGFGGDDDDDDGGDDEEEGGGKGAEEEDEEDEEADHEAAGENFAEEAPAVAGIDDSLALDSEEVGENESDLPAEETAAAEKGTSNEEGGGGGGGADDEAVQSEQASSAVETEATVEGCPRSSESMQDNATDAEDPIAEATELTLGAYMCAEEARFMAAGEELDAQLVQIAGGLVRKPEADSPYWSYARSCILEWADAVVEAMFQEPENADAGAEAEEAEAKAKASKGKKDKGGKGGKGGEEEEESPPETPGEKALRLACGVVGAFEDRCEGWLSEERLAACSGVDPAERLATLFRASDLDRETTAEADVDAETAEPRRPQTARELFFGKRVLLEVDGDLPTSVEDALVLDEDIASYKLQIIVDTINWISRAGPKSIALVSWRSQPDAKSRDGESRVASLQVLNEELAQRLSREVVFIEDLKDEEALEGLLEAEEDDEAGAGAAGAVPAEATQKGKGKKGTAEEAPEVDVDEIPVFMFENVELMRSRGDGDALNSALKRFTQVVVHDSFSGLAAPESSVVAAVQADGLPVLVGPALERTLRSVSAVLQSQHSFVLGGAALAYPAGEPDDVLEGDEKDSEDSEDEDSEDEDEDIEERSDVDDSEGDGEGDVEDDTLVRGDHQALGEDGDASDNEGDAVSNPSSESGDSASDDSASDASSEGGAPKLTPEEESRFGFGPQLRTLDGILNKRLAKCLVLVGPFARAFRTAVLEMGPVAARMLDDASCTDPGPLDIPSNPAAVRDTFKLDTLRRREREQMRRLFSSARNMHIPIHVLDLQDVEETPAPCIPLRDKLRALCSKLLVAEQPGQSVVILDTVQSEYAMRIMLRELGKYAKRDECTLRVCHPHALQQLVQVTKGAADEELELEKQHDADVAAELRRRLRAERKAAEALARKQAKEDRRAARRADRAARIAAGELGADEEDEDEDDEDDEDEDEDDEDDEDEEAGEDEGKAQAGESGAGEGEDEDEDEDPHGLCTAEYLPSRQAFCMVLQSVALPLEQLEQV